MKVVPSNNATAKFKKFERKIPKFTLKTESLNLENECMNSTIFLEQIEEWTSMLAMMMSIYVWNWIKMKMKMKMKMIRKDENEIVYSPFFFFLTQR